MPTSGPAGIQSIALALLSKWFALNENVHKLISAIFVTFFLLFEFSAALRSQRTMAATLVKVPTGKCPSVIYQRGKEETEYYEQDALFMAHSTKRRESPRRNR